MKPRIDGGERLSREAVDRTARDLAESQRKAGGKMTYDQARARVARALKTTERRESGE